MKNIYKTIQKSYELLDLTNDWDHEGGLKPTEIAFNNMILLMTTLVMHIPDIFEPEINPVNNGSIDISFESKTHRLLINVRDTEVSYYGDNYHNENQIKGDLIIFDLIRWCKFYMNEKSEKLSQVYDILVDIGDATPTHKLDFIKSLYDDKFDEWRFQGKLGFGGKYRPRTNTVDCYPEDLNDDTQQIIEKINHSLNQIKF